MAELSTTPAEPVRTVLKELLKELKQVRPYLKVLLRSWRSSSA